MKSWPHLYVTHRKIVAHTNVKPLVLYHVANLLVETFDDGLNVWKGLGGEGGGESV